MCGIIGKVSLEKSEGQITKKVTETLISRGPDNQSYWHDESFKIEMAHLRLSIIDLSMQANQPMHSNDNRFTIVYNGEIYNFEDIKEQLSGFYQWKTNSDTEVILAAFTKWGIECVHRFHGMFSFAIWDGLEQELTLCRDRFGVKPLFYLLNEEGIYFASRPKALLSFRGNSAGIDTQAVRLYLEAGYMPAPYSFYSDIRKLMPGHYLTYKSGKVEISKYYTLNHITTDKNLENVKEEDLLKRADYLINQSVEWRMVSNVTVGSFLSGGIDSSLVTAIMCKKSDRQIKTFNIGFEDPQFDESKYARLISQHLGTSHCYEILKPKDLIDLLPYYFNHFDEPFFDYSAIPLMAVSRLASKDVKVCVSGDGGDEAFGGYHYYRIISNLAYFYKFGLPVRKTLASGLRILGGKWLLLSDALTKNTLKEAFAYSRSVIKSHISIINKDVLNSTFSLYELFDKVDLPESLDIGEVAMRLDINYTLPDDYLQKVDVSTMAFSLEAREPLLDHSILEWTASLPIQWKIRGGINKYLLRQLAYTYVPKDLIDRPKRGFEVPMADWLRKDLKTWAESILFESNYYDAVGLNKKECISVWKRHQKQEGNYHSILWTILVLLQYCESNKV